MIKEDVLFPYNKIRSTQDSFMRAINTAIKNKKDLLGNVPTGTGKTVASLAPTLKHAIENKTTVFFLTPRHTQHKLAIETLRHIKQKYNLKFSVVDFIGKKWMCAIKGADLLSSSEFSEYCKEVKEKGTCEYYLNYKDKTKIIPREVLIKELKDQPHHVEELCEKAEQAKFCPFEIAGDVGKKARVIIGDYFHLLSPTIRESIFNKTELTLENSIIIIDEAQNLPDRCRDLLSTQITTYTIDQTSKELDQFKLTLNYNITAIKEILINLSKSLGLDKQESLIKKDEFIQEIERIFPYDDLIHDFEEKAKIIREEKKKSYLFILAEFLRLWPGQDQGFIRILKRSFNYQGKPVYSLTYRCLDPSVAMRDLLEESRSIICMSGTLYPLEMYKDMLGFKQPIMVEYESPFPKENHLNLIVPETTTRYSQRGKEMYLKIAQKLDSLTKVSPVNTIIFFPSYNLLENIFIQFKELTTKKIFLERQGMSKLEKDDLITKFKEGGILMGVSAGNFGEGIDLPGNLLQSVIIVGLPLGKPDLETKELIEYYDIKFGNGYDYGYTFPAIIKCLQNAGRCIRSETDKGTIVFLDERFGWKNYKKYFPENMHFILTRAPEIRIKEFFENH